MEAMLLDVMTQKPYCGFYANSVSMSYDLWYDATHQSANYDTENELLYLGDTIDNWNELMNLEKTDLNSDVLMDRIREKTEISLESYDPATGDAVLKVIAPGFQIPLNYIRAEYRRSGQDKGERVKLMLREGKMRTYVGTINLSGWEKDGGEILFSLHTAEGTIFEDIISRKVSDLMEQNE